MTLATATQMLREEAGEDARIEHETIAGHRYFTAYDDLDNYLASGRDLPEVVDEAIAEATSINARHNANLVVA